MGFSDERIEALWQRTGQQTRTWLVDPAWLDEAQVESALEELRAEWGGFRWRLYPDGCGGFLVMLEVGRRLIERTSGSADRPLAAARRSASRWFPAIRVQQYEAVGESEPFAVLSIAARWPPTWLCWETTCAVAGGLAELLTERFRT